MILGPTNIYVAGFLNDHILFFQMDTVLRVSRHRTKTGELE
jgi:hypothetical protein